MGIIAASQAARVVRTVERSLKAYTERIIKHFGEEQGGAIVAANLANVVEVTNGISVNRPELSVQAAE